MLYIFLFHYPLFTLTVTGILPLGMFLGWKLFLAMVRQLGAAVRGEPVEQVSDDMIQR